MPSSCDLKFRPSVRRPTIHPQHVVSGGFRLSVLRIFFRRKLLRNFGKSRVHEIGLFGARPKDVFRCPSKRRYSGPVQGTFFDARPNDVFRGPSKRRFSTTGQTKFFDDRPNEVFRRPAKRRFSTTGQTKFFDDRPNGVFRRPTTRATLRSSTWHFLVLLDTKVSSTWHVPCCLHQSRDATTAQRVMHSAS